MHFSARISTGWPARDLVWLSAQGRTCAV